MEWCSVFEASAFSCSCLRLAEPSHHGVAVEVIRLSAAEEGRLLSQEKLLRFLAIVLFRLGIDKRGLPLVADILLDLLLFLVFKVGRCPLTVQFTMHGRELAVRGRLALRVAAVAQPAEAVRPLVEVLVLVLEVRLSQALKVVARPKLLAVATVLLRNLAHGVVLRAECVQQAVASVCLSIVVLVVERALSVVLDCAGARVTLAPLLVVVDEVVVCEAQSCGLEVALLAVGVHQIVHLIRAITCTVVDELSSLLVSLIAARGSMLADSLRLGLAISDLKLGLLLANSLLA